MILALILAFSIFWSKADDQPISRSKKIRSKIEVLKFGLLSGKYGNCIFLQVMLWHMDSAPALKCNDNRLKSWLAGHLRERQCTLEEQVQYVNVWG